MKKINLLGHKCLKIFCKKGHFILLKIYNLLQTLNVSGKHKNKELIANIPVLYLQNYMVTFPDEVLL